MKMKNLYFAEITDTYGGEANYSWVTRHKIAASSARAFCREQRWQVAA
jgi:hypothetical protein